MERPETTLLVLNKEKCPSIRCFHELVRLSWRGQSEAIIDKGYDDSLQVVLFHPFATHDTYSMMEEDDAADYTIRSPYPTMHPLREVDVMLAVQSGYKDFRELPGRNRAKFRLDGVEKCAASLAACKDSRRN